MGKHLSQEERDEFVHCMGPGESCVNNDQTLNHLGSSTVKDEPKPRWLFTPIFPVESSTMRFTRANPRPLPSPV